MCSLQKQYPVLRTLKQFLSIPQFVFWDKQKPLSLIIKFKPLDPCFSGSPCSFSYPLSSHGHVLNYQLLHLHPFWNPEQVPPKMPPLQHQIFPWHLSLPDPPGVPAKGWIISLELILQKALVRLRGLLQNVLHKILTRKNDFTRGITIDLKSWEDAGSSLTSNCCIPTTMRIILASILLICITEECEVKMESKHMIWKK